MMQRGNSKSPRLLVVGARGFLGTFLVQSASDSYDVYRGDRSRESDETDIAIDITDEASVTRAFAEVQPNIVILLAAISDIDRCQRDPQLAFAVNLQGAENVAKACARHGARLLFTSTGAVFDGLKHGYSETDPVSPISIYGESKARAELAVTTLVPDALVLRVSLVLGRTGKAATNSLIDGLMRRWKLNETVSASVIESRNPIDALTLSEWMLLLLKRPSAQGIFHTGSTDAMSRYELTKNIAALLGVSTQLVKPELYPMAGRAPRGADHLLLSTKISTTCAVQPPSCIDVIERSLNEVAEGSLRTGV